MQTLYNKGEINLFKIGAISATIGIPLSFLFGTITPMFWVLVVCMILDIISGIAKGFYNKNLRSRTMWQGGIRKGMIYLVIILANMIDMVVMNGVPVCKTCTICFYIAMEGLSFLENLDAMDVPIPRFIKKYLLSIREQNDEHVFYHGNPDEKDNHESK